MKTTVHMTMLSDDMGDEASGNNVQHLSTQIGEEPRYVVEVFERLAAEYMDDGELSLFIRGYN